MWQRNEKEWWRMRKPKTAVSVIPNATGGAAISPVMKFLWKLKEQTWLQVFALLGIIYIILFNFVPMYGILMAFKRCV